MPEFCRPTTCNSWYHRFSTTLLRLSSFLFSHFFSYFLVFSPGLLPPLSPVSPLFPAGVRLLRTAGDLESLVKSFFSATAIAGRNVLEWLGWRSDNGRREPSQVRKDFEELETCKLVFEVADCPIRDDFEVEFDHGRPADGGRGVSPEALICNSDAGLPQEKEIRCVAEGSEVEERPSMKLASEPVKGGNPQKIYRHLGSFGRIARKEKEWKRTLACKLFEERHSRGGDGDMDALWETYDADPSDLNPKSCKSGSKARSNKGTKRNHRSNSNSERSDPGKGDEGEDEDRDTAELCCLEALKFSSVTMNLGMGRPEIARICKSFKAIGLFRHGKKKLR